MGSDESQQFRSSVTDRWNASNELLTKAKRAFPGSNRIIGPDSDKLPFRGRSWTELLNAYGVFTTCAIKPVVANADKLIALGEAVVGKKLTYGIIKHTFFAHFCGGENVDDIRPTIDRLQRHRINTILDYAAESDLDAPVDGEMPSEVMEATPQSGLDMMHAKTPSGMYPLSVEKYSDLNNRLFLTAINAAADVTPPGETAFVSVKVTALANPNLLERVSTVLTEMHRLFERFDVDGDGFVSWDEFEVMYPELFVEPLKPGDEDARKQRMLKVFRYLDPKRSGYIDLVQWSSRFRIEDLPSVVSRCRSGGPLLDSMLTAEELQLWRRLQARVHSVASRASALGVKVLVDAEHSYFQRAIDNLAMQVMAKFNRGGNAVVMNTYQCYLKDSHTRLLVDLERAERENFTLGAKLVRGAYMNMERERAAERGYPDPIHDTLQDTHDCYNRSVAAALLAARRGRAALMVASHNAESIELTGSMMNQLEMEPSAPVYFAQLYGMADDLTWPLAAKGYRAYKYLPYGPVAEVVPYLVRRAVENASVMAGPGGGGAGAERRKLRAEFWRRLTGRASPAAAEQEVAQQS
ncbi:unnamed protein product [Pedinophyceae sp. YPF-701]|nr:unnamed protein product [Pedinophyceae sp. YPF-701]